MTFKILLYNYPRALNRDLIFFQHISENSQNKMAFFYVPTFLLNFKMQNCGNFGIMAHGSGMKGKTWRISQVLDHFSQNIVWESFYHLGQFKNFQIPRFHID